MLFVLTVASFLLLGGELSRRFWSDRHEELHPLEKWCSSILIGTVIWLASIWLASAGHLMSRPFVIGRTVAVAVIGVVLRWRRLPVHGLKQLATISIDRRTAGMLLIAVLPIVGWTEFVLWRSAVVPPLNHDALAYHLPKAVLFSRAGGYAYLADLDPMTRKIPANYELMLADILTAAGNDDHTEWLTTLFYAFIVLGSGALVQRWWGRYLAAELAVMLLVAGAPIMLLHTGAHKNDLMTTGFMVAMLLWSSRWIAKRQPQSLLLAIAATAAAIGTKPQAAALGAMLAPFIIAAWWKERDRWSFRGVAAVVLAGVVALGLLGGAVFVANSIHERGFAGQQPTVGNAEAAFTYGDWANLWQGPYVLLMAPFSTSPWRLDVPWSSEPWFWRRYELFFSHLGVAFSLCALLLPLAIGAFRKVGTESARAERWQVGTAVAIAFVVILPVIFVPHGMYVISLPRYALFILPVVFAFTVAPALVVLEAWSRAAAVAAIAAFAVLFIVYAVDLTIRDSFVPLRYVLWARQNPGTRVIPFDPNRAASIVDRLAGPDEPIAMHAGFASWIHPAFGAALRRPVRFIADGEGAPAIGDDVRFVIVDRGWRTIWQVPGFTDISQARRFLARGKPSEADLRVVRHLQNDPRFRLLFYNRTRNQAVFQRVR